jgi:hypothetical protein
MAVCIYFDFEMSITQWTESVFDILASPLGFVVFS